MATATKKATAATPQVGARVIHHGHLHDITRIGQRARIVEGKPVLMRFAVWDNERFQVTGFLDELRWSEDDQAWYLTGRVLSRNERALAEALTGSWPKAENHIAVRAMLDAVDLATVNRAKLATVLVRRKADLQERLSKLGADPAKRDPKAVAKIVDTYVDAALEQCAALRASRQEG